MSEELKLVSDNTAASRVFHFPIEKHSDWKCSVAGISYVPLEGKEPNAFWRLMQYLILGAKWTRR